MFPFTVYFFMALATLTTEVPLVRPLERAVCNSYYRSHSDFRTDAQKPVDESLCKVADIQDTLAFVVGWKMSFDALPSTHIALPIFQIDQVELVIKTQDFLLLL